MRLAPLRRSDLDDARALVSAALPHDHVAVVVEEKLFGDDGARTGAAFGAWRGDALAGVIAGAGRWIKLLAVAAEARGHGIGTALVDTYARLVPGAVLRVGDHPGNYLSPGVDERYGDGLAFLARRGFVAVGAVENLRAPLDGNPLVAPRRRAALVARVEAEGYQVRRATAADAAHLGAYVAGAFAPVWATEVARALAGPRRAVHVALWRGTPVAFAAADGNNQGLGWFGPAGTDPAHRGRGLGEALLIACLDDVRGLPDGGVIAWIGPRSFYTRSCGAVGDRRFVLVERRA